MTHQSRSYAEGFRLAVSIGLALCVVFGKLIFPAMALSANVFPNTNRYKNFHTGFHRSFHADVHNNLVTKTSLRAAANLRLVRGVLCLSASRFPLPFQSPAAPLKTASQPAAKRRKSSRKPSPKASANQPLRIPQPARSDAIVQDSLRSEHLLEVLTDVSAERGVVRLTLRESQAVEIVAFNILGKRVVEVYSGEAKAGMNTVSFDLSGLSNGVYICVVRGQGFKTAQKFLVSR